MVTNTQKIHQYPTLPSFPVATRIACTLYTGLGISWRSVKIFQRKHNPYYRRYIDIMQHIDKSLHNDLRDDHSIILGFMIFQTQLCVNETNNNKGLSWKINKKLFA